MCYVFGMNSADNIASQEYLDAQRQQAPDTALRKEAVQAAANLPVRWRNGVHIVRQSAGFAVATTEAVYHNMVHLGLLTSNGKDVHLMAELAVPVVDAPDTLQLFERLQKALAVRRLSGWHISTKTIIDPRNATVAVHQFQAVGDSKAQTLHLHTIDTYRQMLADIERLPVSPVDMPYNEWYATVTKHTANSQYQGLRDLVQERFGDNETLLKQAKKMLDEKKEMSEIFSLLATWQQMQPYEIHELSEHLHRARDTDHAAANDN